jgi:hypothetical protein
MSKKNDILTLEDQTTMLSQNTENQLHINAPSYSRRTQTSATSLQKPKTLPTLYGFSGMEIIIIKKLYKL